MLVDPILDSRMTRWTWRRWRHSEGVLGYGGLGSMDGSQLDELILCEELHELEIRFGAEDEAVLEARACIRVCCLGELERALEFDVPLVVARHLGSRVPVWIASE